jgi:hypothetical protein
LAFQLPVAGVGPAAKTARFQDDQSPIFRRTAEVLVCEANQLAVLDCEGSQIEKTLPAMGETGKANLEKST